MTVWILLGVAAALVLGFAAGAKIPLVYNLRNLTVRWRTTLLTALAFTLVTALLVVMLAFVNGMERLTAASGQPGNVLVLAEGSTDETFSNLNVGDLSEIEIQPQVVRGKDGRPVASRETYMVVNQPVPDAPPGRPKRRFLQLRGVADAALAADVHRIKLLPGGTWFSASGVREDPAAGSDHASARPMIEVVLGEGIARELGRDRPPEKLASARNRDRLDVGDEFFLGEELESPEGGAGEARPLARKWVVVGVMDSAGSTFDSELWGKQSLIAPLFGKDTFTSMVLRTADDEAAQNFKEFLNNAGKDPENGKEAEKPAASGFKKTTVNALVEKDYYQGMTETTRQFLVAIVIVTVFIAVGGVFGVMNTMFAAISQRIKDIGMLRMLGYARWQILVSFLLESLVIALVGGTLGCLLGTVANGWTATCVVAGHTSGGKLVVLKLVVAPGILAMGVLVSLIMGIVGGLLPALSAMRLKPLDALR